MKIFLGVLLLVSTGTAGPAQTTPPLTLFQAAQCLKGKNFVPAVNSATPRFGYFLDPTSYPQQEVLYVVEFTRPSNSGGTVFTILLTWDSGLQIFNIQNNARFISSNNGINGIDFPDPPLGGNWSQERVVSAIKKIEQGPKYAIQQKDLSGTSPGVRCESYADQK